MELLYSLNCEGKGIGVTQTEKVQSFEVLAPDLDAIFLSVVSMVKDGN